MAERRAEPFDETLLWAAVAMSCAGIVLLLVGGGLAELLGNRLMTWLSLLAAGGLSAPIAGMVIGADTCPAGEDVRSRSSHGFAIGGAVLGFCLALSVKLLVAFA